MAEALLRDLAARTDPHADWHIESAGCWARPGNPPTNLAIQVMQQHGIDIHGHLSQPVTGAFLERFNLILCMEAQHQRHILRNFPFAQGKTFLLYEMVGKSQEIRDPVGLSLSAYENTADEMINVFHDGFDQISSLSSLRV